MRGHGFTSCSSLNVSQVLISQLLMLCCVYDCDERSVFHIFLRKSNTWSFIPSLVFFTIYGYITDSQCDHLVALTAQLVEHCIGIAEVMGSHPSLFFFFSGFNFTTAWGNSSEIKLTIDFCSYFVHWIFIIWELQFWNKKGGAHAHWGTVRHWKCPILALFNACYKNAFSVIVKSLWAQTHKNMH